MVEKQYTAVKDMLGRNQELLDRVASQLLEKESLDEGEFKALVEPLPV
jgi:ATP-dependent Zn protease